MEKKSKWSFGTREVVYGALGAALYGVFSWFTNFIQLPGAGSISFRPAVAIPMFFGIAFGPIVGFISGAVGNILGDFLSGWGFWWSWDVGNGIMGLIPGLIYPLENFRSTRSLLLAEVFVVLGAGLGNLFSSLMEIPLYGADFTTAITVYWLPAFGNNTLNGLILVPILMVAYDALLKRRSR